MLWSCSKFVSSIFRKMFPSLNHLTAGLSYRLGRGGKLDLGLGSISVFLLLNRVPIQGLEIDLRGPRICEEMSRLMNLMSYTETSSETFPISPLLFSHLGKEEHRTDTALCHHPIPSSP